MKKFPLLSVILLLVLCPASHAFVTIDSAYVWMDGIVDVDPVDADPVSDYYYQGYDLTYSYNGSGDPYFEESLYVELMANDYDFINAESMFWSDIDILDDEYGQMFHVGFDGLAHADADVFDPDYSFSYHAFAVTSVHIEFTLDTSAYYVFEDWENNVAFSLMGGDWIEPGEGILEPGIYVLDAIAEAEAGIDCILGDGSYIYTSLNLEGIPSVPIPGAVWLLGSGLISVLGARRKK